MLSKVDVSMKSLSVISRSKTSSPYVGIVDLRHQNLSMSERSQYARLKIGFSVFKYDAASSSFSSIEFKLPLTLQVVLHVN